jgi:hypothetical protein
MSEVWSTMFAMAHPDWREPVRLLRLSLTRAAAHQLALATLIGCRLDTDLPFNVAAARLEAFLEPKIRGTKHAVEAPTEGQMRFLTKLCPAFEVRCESRAEISAWIDHYLALATIAAHEKLKLKSGDVVQVSRSYRLIEIAEARHELAVVSSIGANGRVYLKGGNGAGAWPAEVQHHDRS